MDFSLQTPEERCQKVQEIISNTPSERLTPKYLEMLSDYIICAMTKQEKRTKNIITSNRSITINKRERSYEGLATQLENGEDGIYGMIAEDKNIIFSPRTSITDEDVATIPGLAQLRNEITKLESQIAATPRGRRLFLLKKQLIEMRQDQYVLKSAYKKPIYSINLIKSLSKLDLTEEIDLDENNEPYSTGLINLYNPRHISILLCNYSRLKQDSYTALNSDIKWLLFDLEDLIDNSIKPLYPKYFTIIVDKIDGLSNTDIQTHLSTLYNVKHSVEYISVLWRQKIPNAIAQAAKINWLEHHYTNEERGHWKRCSRCHRIKLAHSYFFSKNNTSKDGFYSICKECRNKGNKNGN
jgi:hypothetical protein